VSRPALELYKLPIQRVMGALAGYITRGKLCKIYKIAQIKMVWTY
jgi:hypothetical protein